MADELPDTRSGVCQRCGGLRWVPVGEGWVREMAAKQPNRVGYEAALRNTVYPCKGCSPGTFYRWANGCLDADHDPFTCDRCQNDADNAELRRTRRRGRRARLAPAGHRVGPGDEVDE